MNTDKPRRRWFRFGLRTMFVVLTVFGVWLGWQVNIVQKRKNLRPWIEEHQVMPSTLIGIHIPHPQLSWVRSALGDESMPWLITFPRDVDKEKLREVKHWFPEAAIGLND